MKVDFAAPILDLKGGALIENGEQVTLGAIASNALLAAYRDEADLAGEEKVKRYKLAVIAEGEQDLSVEQVVLLKKLIAKAFAPLIVGRAYELLDPQPKIVTYLAHLE
jgi:hypothetical protein